MRYDRTRDRAVGGHRKPLFHSLRHAVCAWVLLLSILASCSAAWAQAIDPQAAAHVRAGIEARQQKRLDDAARELEAAARLAPQIAEIHLNLGLVRHEQGEYAKAVDSLRAALEVKPEVTDARGLLGFDLLSLGWLPEAIEQLERSCT